MDEYTRKRSDGGLGFSKRASSITLQDTNDEGKGIQYCNRLGCSTRPDSMKNNIGSPEKLKFSKASFRTSSSKSFSGSSSKTFSSPTDFRKSRQEKDTRTPLRHTAESSITQMVAEDIKLSSQQVESDASKATAKTTTIETVLPETEGSEFPNLQELSTIQTKSSTFRPQKQIHHQLEPSSQDTPSLSSSSTRRSVAPRNMGHVTKPYSYLGSGPPRYGLKNIRCSSISDVLPSRGSSSNLINSRKVNSVRNRPSNGESSSSGGKNTVGSSISNLSASSGSLMQQQGFKRAKSRPSSRDCPVSVRTRRAPVGDSRARLPEQQNENNVSISEPIVNPQLPHSQISTLEPVPESSSRFFPMEARPVIHNSFGGQPSSSGRSTARSRLLSSHPSDSSRHGVSRDRDEYRRFNMEGIAEVLLALERIEQDDELTYEQLMVLETNLFLGGFSFNDQHRDMRLDIDNMTYEELLALEEKMGTVSTALPEEALSKCLTKSIYIPLPHFPGITACGDDDTKCCICQEDYVPGEELAKLACDHRYHEDCIYQWLRQKSWCPICKTSAASPEEERKN